MTTGLTFEQASARTSCQIRYGRSPVERRFHEFGISGSGPLDSAIEPGKICELGSEWAVDFADEAQAAGFDDTSVDWVAAMFSATVIEATHEALEWFQVDGERYIDPHDAELVHKITNAARSFASLLIEIREGRQ